VKHRLSSSALSSISKVANKCLFSQPVHFISGTRINPIFTIMQVSFPPSFPPSLLPSHCLSLSQTLSFSLCVSLLGIIDGAGRRWQINSGHPAGPSVCRQKIELIWVFQMLMLSSLRLCFCVCAAQSEGRIGRLAGGGGACWRRWGLAHIRLAAFVLASKRTAMA